MEEIMERASVFKALGDQNRLKILHMLTERELCACEILENFQITQPTLSHHMKILCDTELVSFVKKGKWIFYTINHDKFEKIKLLFESFSHN